MVLGARVPLNACLTLCVSGIVYAVVTEIAACG